MTYKDLGALTDPLEAVKSLFAEMTAIKEELSATKSDVARLNRNNTKLVVENRNLKAELAQTKAELAKLKSNAPVEKDSTNSSIPPTKQSIAKQIIQHTTSLRKPSGKNPGGQAGHAGHSLEKNSTPDRTIEHKAKTCPHCGHTIPEDTEQVCFKTIQRIEIAGPMQPCVVTEHKYYSAVCPNCRKAARAESVTGDCKKVMYGPVLQTMVVYLSVVQSVPYNRIAEIMRDIFMVPTFSEGTVKNILSKNRDKATPVYDSILSYIEMFKAAGMDETGMYINQKLCWFWCLQCPKLCYVFADESRGLKALERHGILKHLEGIFLCTDRHGTYFKLKVMGHQVCLVHLLRNLQYLCDLNKQQRWASDIQDLLRRAIHESNTKPREQIDIGKFKKQLHQLLEQDVSSYERKGEKDFQALQNGLLNCEQYIFTFLEQEGVPHHNNASEGAIRILKVKSKVSGGFRTAEGADEYACFHSIVETAKRNGVSKFETLFRLVSDMAPKDDFIGKLLSEND
jgi:regulator of replication initiation timing/transposase